MTGATGDGRPAVGSARVTPGGAAPAPPPRQPPTGQVYGGKPAAAKASVPIPAQSPPPGAAPPPAPVPGSSRKRKRLLLAVLVPLLVLLALLGTGVTVQLKRDLPAATLTTSIASTLKIPGKLSLPWPSQGSAELMVEGLGRLGGSGAAKPAAIGSVAKVMTAYVILKNHPLSGGEEGPDITVTAADVADYQARIASGQSLVAVAAGERISEREALEALMLPSANNVAHMLGVWDAGSQDAFLTRMNQAADELGMKNTHYTDPSGFLPSTVSTAADQVLLGRAALKDPVFAAIVAQPSATIPVAGAIKNYNDLLGELGVFGIKTGSTDDAGGNLLFSAHLQVAGRTFTVVGAVFQQPGSNTPQQLAQVNRVVRKLLTAVRAAVKQYTILADKALGQVSTAWGSTVPVSPAAPLKVVGWPGLSYPVKVVSSTVGTSVTSGQTMAKVSAGGQAVDLTADGSTTPPTTWWKLSRRP
ncbi:D-alanyl-D-alanine carboxypeptidase family protein [Actinoplanes sp. CA-030573]|uniref:D-alanyl-D-alanine carboxypeptidase family protein n=1 Tax=Actinoplanes sp. CA-030573 TaxID=3239898 RepID=UPI003D8F3732